MAVGLAALVKDGDPACISPRHEPRCRVLESQPPGLAGQGPEKTEAVVSSKVSEALIILK